MRASILLICCLYFSDRCICQTVLGGNYINCIKCDSLEKKLKGNWLKEEQASTKWVNSLPIRIFFKHLDTNSKQEFIKYNWCFGSIDTSANCNNDSIIKNWNGYIILSIYKKDHSTEPRNRFPFFMVHGDTMKIGKQGEANYIRQNK